MYIGAKKAGREIEKFEAVLDGDTWPLQMQTTRVNILHTTQFDSEISLNDGNDSTMLPYLVESYKKCCPAIHSIKIAKWERSFAKDTESASPQSEANFPVPEEPTENDASHTVEFNSMETLPVGESTSKNREKLQEFGISIIPAPPEEYARDILAPDFSPNVDFVLTEISSTVSSEERNLVVKIWKRVLKPGSAVFAIVTWECFSEWYKELQGADFVLMPHPFVIVPRTSKLRKTRTFSTPQQAAFFAVVAFVAGRRADGFQVDLSTPYTRVTCTHKRKFALIDGVLPPTYPLTNKGSRSPLVKTERNVNLFCEIMTTFSPPNATVFDPFGGPLSTACASLLSERRCTVLQNSQEVLSVALGRLVALSEAGEYSRHSRRNDQKEQARVRAMFDMYNDVRNSEKTMIHGSDRELDVSDYEDRSTGTNEGDNFLSPITPAFKNSARSSTERLACNVMGCLQPNKSVTNAENGNYGHRCCSCDAPVHLLCVSRILGISVADSDTPLYCSGCFN